MSLSTTPPEILLNIMESLSVGDIVRAAQSCSYLRKFVLSNKTPLAKAYNRASTIHLPLGLTPDNISSELLYQHAVKSMATAARLSESINSVPIQPRKNITYSLEDLDIEWDEAYRRTSFVRDNILAFINPDDLFVLLLGPSGDIEKHARVPMNSSGSKYEVAYQMSADENSLFVVLVTIKAGVGKMRVLEMCIAKEGFGTMTTHLDIRLANRMYDSCCVAIRDPYCVVANCRSVFLVDWRAQRGGVFTPFSKTDEQGPGSTWPLHNISSVVIHPQEPLLVIFDDDDSEKNPNSGIHLSDIPESSGRLMKKLQELTSLDYYYSRMERSLTWKSPFVLTPRYGRSKMYPTGFRCLSKSSWILDVLVIGTTSISEDLDSAPSAFNENQALARVSFDSSDNWTAHVETIEATSVTSHSNNFSFYGSDRMAGSAFFYRYSEDQSDLPIIVPKFEDGNGNGSGLIQLRLPAELWNVNSSDGDEVESESTNEVGSDSTDEGEMDHYLRSLWTLGSAIFDQLTGRLYIAHRQGFQILQY
ncbi:hypothetical protein SISSUDRAFT_1132701 [Sistotremastrum suecicum HHB10207 ss-3]|uniref:F-box domain-containing protein n=1 Tax=Sistotremastrum suecicum HHB10207 ss-3 TaxID=1314776 RepID=A0A165YFJ6_9AGAM|nr:hypothetical protein SISSUDRAFT_1132701 [Sistotremastrum suecicum HHB10207 ss-3]